MKNDSLSEGGVLEIKYAGGEAVLIDFFVLLVGSLAAIALLSLLATHGVSMQTLDKYALALSVPWFAALYFVSWRLKKGVRKGFSVSLSFRSMHSALQIAGPVAVAIVMISWLAKLLP